MSLNRMHSHFDAVNLIGKLADLKEMHYRQTLLLSAVTELLIDKGVFTAQELEARMSLLDNEPLITMNHDAEANN